MVYVQSRPAVTLHCEHACSSHESHVGPIGCELTALVSPTGVVRAASANHFHPTRFSRSFTVARPSGPWSTADANAREAGESSPRFSRVVLRLPLVSSPVEVGGQGEG